MQNVHHENKVNILNRPQDPMLLCAVTLVTHSPRSQPAPYSVSASSFAKWDTNSVPIFP